MVPRRRVVRWRRCGSATAVAALTLLFATPAPAATVLPSCALGRVPADLRTALPGAIAAERTRLGDSLRGVRGDDRRSAEATFEAAVAAYVYGMPTVLQRRTVQTFTRNRIVSIGELTTPKTRTVVAPNHDTLYSVSQLDLSEGPLVIDMPATKGRYAILQLLDAYTNVVDYVGSGRDRDKPETVALVPPGWTQPLPAGVRIVRSPTKLVWLLGRTLIDDDADLPAAKLLMGTYSLTPLADWTAGARVPSLVLDAFPTNRPKVTLPVGLAFFDELGAALAADPPPARDACALKIFATAGIGPGQTPSTATAPGAAAILKAAAAAGDRVVDVAVSAKRRASQRRYNGWSAMSADTGRFGTDYANRAVVARVGLGANVPSEAVYPATDTDVRGRPLTGAGDYTVSFPAKALPPVRAFWSLTLYDRDLFLAPNALDRYTLGDRSKGLRYGKDGSLTIYVRRKGPTAALRSNWLPAPDGRFLLYLRLYEPKPDAVGGDWTPPTVTRTR